jgi:uncharacterized protein (DUF2164 family)
MSGETKMPNPAARARKWLDDFLGAKYTSYSEALDDACAVIRRLLAANERLEAEVTDYLKICQNYANDLRKYVADRAALVAGLTDFYEVIERWSRAYPVDVFIEPPPGEHGTTVDACSARMGRHIFEQLLKDWEALVMQGLSDELRSEIDEYE